MTLHSTNFSSSVKCDHDLESDKPISRNEDFCEVELNEMNAEFDHKQKSSTSSDNSCWSSRSVNIALTLQLMVWILALPYGSIMLGSKLLHWTNLVAFNPLTYEKVFHQHLDTLVYTLILFTVFGLIGACASFKLTWQVHLFFNFANAIFRISIAITQDLDLKQPNECVYNHFRVFFAWSFAMIFASQIQCLFLDTAENVIKKYITRAVALSIWVLLVYSCLLGVYITPCERKLSP